ncbi:hypothetical protein AAC387_Pa06g0098 [Persea americana]
MSSSSSSSQTLERANVQNVIVMRHGDRLDNFEPLWVASAKRPWDPPLTEVGKIRAWNTGKKLRKNLGFKIDRVFVSPFLRCIQTAYEAISALCAQGDYDLMETSENAIIDPSTVKVSIEYGLCEALSREAISIDLVPKDGIWLPDLSELEAILPAGTLDHSVERVYKELPKWEEPIENARRRYKEVIMALADKYPHENLLLVTHGEGVGVSVSAFLKATVYEVEYCACSHLQRPISFKSTGKHTAQEFKVLTDSNTGILFM